MDPRSYLELFLAESREHLGAAYGLQSALEREPGRREALTGLLRHAHSLKGMASTIGIRPIVVLTHAMEELLERLSERPPDRVRGCLPLLGESLACLGELLDRVERREPEECRLAPELARKLSAFDPDPGAAEPWVEPDDERTPFVAGGGDDPVCWRIELHLRGPVAESAATAVRALLSLAESGRVLRTSPPRVGAGAGGFESGLVLVLASPLPRNEIERRLDTLFGPGSSTLAPAPRRVPEDDEEVGGARWVRVRADRLDAMADGLLDLRREQARLKAALPPNVPEAVEHALRCEFHFKQAYGTLMDLQLVPFDSIAHRLHRSVHELSSDLGKEVRFEILGGHVQLDRTVLEAIVDPLLHAVRNAMDHGLEHPGIRVAEGKPRSGRLVVRLSRRADGVRVAIEDDGRGMRPAKLRARALALGLIDRERAAALSDESALLLTTLPGFTTATRVDHVSGRGIGLDVVKDAVVKLGGSIEIHSTPNRGSSIRLLLPAGEALVRSLLFRSRGELFAVPIDAVDRAVDLGGDDVPPCPSLGPLRRVRLGLDGPGAGPDRGAQRALLLALEPDPVALVVDEVLGRRDLLVRPLRGPLADLRPYSGAAVLADGSIALVLDPEAFAA